MSTTNTPPKDPHTCVGGPGDGRVFDVSDGTVVIDYAGGCYLRTDEFTASGRRIWRWQSPN